MTTNRTAQTITDVDLTATSLTTLDLGREYRTWREGRPQPVDAIVGRQAVHTTWEGRRIVGTIVSRDEARKVSRQDHYPVVRFANGQWARLDNRVTLVNR